MKRTKYFFYTTISLLSISLFVSCDKEFNGVGSDLVDYTHFGVSSETYPVIAYNQKIGVIQSNNLPINPLGIYDNPAFGTTTASFATQLSLASTYTVGANPIIESVELRIPYFSTLKTTNSDGTHVYELDSIYGAANGKIKLSIYESGYYMRNLDPDDNFLSAQKFYTNQKTEFESKIKQDIFPDKLNNDTDVSQNDAFFFSAAEFADKTTGSDGKETTTYTAPQMRLKLMIKDNTNDHRGFQEKIFSQEGIASLKSNELFKDYFRGLYFKVERSGSSEPAMALLNFAKGTIIIKYKEDSQTSGAAKVDKTITLNLSGNTVSFPEASNENIDYLNATTSPNTSGDAKLYLKGGAGSMAIIDLFKAGEIPQIKAKGWLINEAYLVFNIDANAMADAKTAEPNRIFLYDFNNSRTIIDYPIDATTTTSNPKNNKTVFGGYIVNSTTGAKRGLTYKIRITNHVRNLIKNDSTNVRLGLVVTEDIANTTQSVWKTPLEVILSPTESFYIKKTPQASVMNPLGTVLYGSNPAVPADKRLKLEIFYTKPE
jgi:Domain of unknown function (DUF4270)